MARRSRNDSGVSGVCVVDKPAGMTSHDVVAVARRVLGTRKVGHSGTLDPDATGVLVLGVGNATRLLRFLTVLPKTYVGEIVLGVETSTLDAAGEVTARHDMTAVTPPEVVAAAARFVGDIEQIPPMVSAVKIDGKRLHELARQGIEVERKPRPVTVYRFDVEPVDGEPLVWRAHVDCSSGTYVRTLAADLGHALGGGAHLRALRRTAIGDFDLARSQPLKRDGQDHLDLEPVTAAVAHLNCIEVGDEVAVDVRHGKVMDRDRLGVNGDGPWPVLTHDGVLLAVYEPYRDGVKPLMGMPS